MLYADMKLHARLQLPHAGLQGRHHGRSGRSHVLRGGRGDGARRPLRRGGGEHVGGAAAAGLCAGGGCGGLLRRGQPAARARANLLPHPRVVVLLTIMPALLPCMNGTVG